mgnify:CR=1 FL=1
MNNKESIKKIVLAYSGGLDTSIIIPWLKENYNNPEIIAVSGDVGQGTELDGLEEKALKTGASKLIVADLVDEMVDEVIIPALKMDAKYETYLLGTAFARPVIGKKLAEIALAEGADAVCHGATGKGNDQVRFELSINALAPKLQVIAPWRMKEWRDQFPGRTELIQYAESHGIPIRQSMKKPYSMDRNLLHISYEAGILEDTWYDATKEEDRGMYVLSNAPEDAPDAPQYLQCLFEKGNIIGLQTEGLAEIMATVGTTAQGEKDGYTLLDPLGVMLVLNYLGGKHGIGRVDIIENRFVGMKSRGIYETPGGTILLAAHRDIETITMDREAQKVRDSLIPDYAAMVYNGFWFAPEREAIQALVTKTQETVNGEVRLKLYKGNVMYAGRRSPNSLYSYAMATMEADYTEEDYNQDDASGFIHLNGLRLKQFARVNH